MKCWLPIKIIWLFLGLSAWAFLFAASAKNYEGSLLIFSIFSLSFLMLLIAGFYKNKSYSFMFLSLLLWFGFWLKLIVHLILNYAYVEPVGVFDGSKEAWDQVLWVATIAGLGVLAGRWLYVIISSRMIKIDSIELAYPVWYPALRWKIWVFLIVTIITVAILNTTLGIQQIGLATRTTLPWPLNAVIAWLVSIGSAMGLATLVWWDITLKKPVMQGALAILAEAFISTMSLFSRGIFVFHSVPQLFALYKNRIIIRGFSKFVVLTVGGVLLLLFVVSIASVTTLRAYYYPHLGGFTTEEQLRLTRMEVLEGGIAHVKDLIRQGEQQEGHLLELLKEREELRRSTSNIKGDTELDFKRAYKEKSSSVQQESAKLYDLKIDINKEQIQDKGLVVVRVPENERIPWVIAESEVQVENGGHEELKKFFIEKNVVDQSLDVASTPEVAGSHEALETGGSMKSVNSEQSRILDEIVYQLKEGVLKKVMALAVDRWVGIEGVMAVVSYPRKSSDLLIEAVKEKREIGKVTRYQEISKSHYQWTDSKVWQFASLPGAVAFLYFSGSLWVVFLGMILFVVFVQLAEQSVYRVTGNPILCSLLGMVLANFVLQFGITPRQDLPYFLMIIIAVITIGLVQSIKTKGKG